MNETVVQERRQELRTVLTNDHWEIDAIFPTDNQVSLELVMCLGGTYRPGATLDKTLSEHGWYIGSIYTSPNREDPRLRFLVTIADW